MFKKFVILFFIAISITWGYFTFRSTDHFDRLPQEYVDILYDLTELVDQEFDAAGIRYTICGGTLLGAVRQGGMIPWDDDVDILVLKEDGPKIEALKTRLEEKGYLLVESKLGYRIEWAQGPMHRGGYRYPFMDVCFMEIHDETLVLACPQCREQWPNCKLSVDVWNDLEKIPFGHLKLWAPRGQEAINYLDRRFGTTWRSQGLYRSHIKNRSGSKGLRALGELEPALHSKMK